MSSTNKKTAAKLALASVAILLVSAALFATAFSSKNPVAPPAPAPINVSLPAPIIDHTRPLAIMIDNHPDARPQSGLAKADAVWETLVEGGLTRTMAIFRSASATEIGPVRSARPYFLDWAREADAVYGHVGGSDEALSDLAQPGSGLNDANEFSNGAAYWRDTRRDAPHNTYTSSERLRALIASKKWNATTDAFDLSPRDAGSATGTPASLVAVTYAENGEREEFRWNARKGGYELWRNGRQALDRDGAAIVPKTVVVLETRLVPIDDPHGKGLVGIVTTGSGTATVFRSGVALFGTWQKSSATEPTEVRAADGQKIPFSRGQVWYAVVASNRGGGATFQ